MNNNNNNNKIKKKDKEGVCYFLKSRLPTAPGTLDVVVPRDTGCIGVVVRRNVVSQDQLIGKELTVTLIDETKQRHSLAVINVDCPFLRVKLRHCTWMTLCMTW